MEMGQSAGGGDASLTVSGDVTVDTLEIVSGKIGESFFNWEKPYFVPDEAGEDYWEGVPGYWDMGADDYYNAGGGGTAALNAGTLTATTIDLTKNNGALNVNVGTLNVQTQGAKLILDNTAAGSGGGSGVFFNSIDIDTGKRLEVERSNNGDYGFGTLNVLGVGAEYKDTQALIANGKTLRFHLPSSADQDDVMLKVITGSPEVNLNGSTIELVWKNDAPSPGNLGEKLVTLIDHTTGAPAVNAPAVLEDNSGVKYAYGAKEQAGGSLVVYHNSVDTSGDWTAPGSYSVDSTFGAVSLTVGGKLSVTDSLTLTKVGGNELTVEAGRLDVAQAAKLILDNTAAGNGSGSGVFFNSIDIASGKQLEVDRSNNGDYGFNTLNVLGINAGYKDSGTLATSGKTLKFHLPASSDPSDVMLKVDETTAAVNLNGSTVAWEWQDKAPTPGNLGEKLLTLIDKTTGAPTTLPDQKSLESGGVKYGYDAKALTDSLVVYHNSLGTAGDWQAPANYSVDSSIGEVSLNVGGKLSVIDALTLTKANGNELTVEAGTLDVLRNTALNLDGTAAAGSSGSGSGVFFDNIDLAAGKQLEVVRSNNGDYGFKTLNVLGVDTEYKDTQALITNGKTLKFHLPASADPSDVMLKVDEATPAVNLAGSTIALGWQGAVPLPGNLNLGEKLLTLIDKTTGAPTTLPDPASMESGGVEYSYATKARTDSLVMYHNSLETAGDWQAPANYSVDSSIGDVSLTVGGKLSVTDSLTLTKANGNELTVEAGTLDVLRNSKLNLDGTAAAGSSGSGSGVFFNNIDLAAGKQLEVVRSNNGDYGFKTLNVLGVDTEYKDTQALITSGKTLKFHLPASADPSDVMLKVDEATPAVNLAGSIIALEWQGAVPLPGNLNLGEKLLTLIDKTTGAPTTLPDPAVREDNGVEYGYATKALTDSLVVYHNSLATDEDWKAPAGYSATSSIGAVSLKVGGMLSVTDSLTLTKVNGNELTVNAGTLDVTEGNATLNLNGTAGTGVFFKVIDLDNGRKLSVTRSDNGDYTFSTLNVRGKSAAYEDNGTLDATGKTLNFHLTPEVEADDVMLAAPGTVAIADSTRVEVGVEGESPLQAGDSVTLIQAGILSGARAATTSSGSGLQGVSLEYEFEITADLPNNRLLARLPAGPIVNPQLKAIAEGILAGPALLNQSADLLASARLRQLTGYGVFGILSGGRLRYDTGSHLDMRSLSLLTGVSAGADLAPGRLTLGAFFEYGAGSYDTYNSFSNAASVRGDGNVHHTGGGVLGRMDFSDTGPGRFYAEGSARAGRLYNHYGNDDLRDAAGRGTGFEYAVPYYGLHAGAGYVWNLTDEAALELYGTYFWTRQEGDSVRLRTGDPVSFKAVDSHRARGGARVSHSLNESFDAYAGAAYEYEFAGRARAKAYGYDITRPDLTGGTGIGEFGLRLKPSASLPLSVDLGLQGHTGAREGVSGSLELKYEF